MNRFKCIILRTFSECKVFSTCRCRKYSRDTALARVANRSLADAIARNGIVPDVILNIAMNTLHSSNSCSK